MNTVIVLLAAAGSAFLLCVLAAVTGLPVLRGKNFRQSIRDCGPEKHLQKSGTPTMGGLFMLPAIIISALLWGRWDAKLFMAIFLLTGYGLIGFADDYIKIRRRHNLGLTSGQKILAQAFLAAVFIAWTPGGVLRIPFADGPVDIGVLYHLLAFLLLVGTTNAVNLTDGLDGLAAGATLPVMLVYAFIACYAGQFSLAVFAMAVGGACAGFLLFNRHPAQVFMGDTGSMALGGALAVLALLTGTELFLPVIGGLYVIETLSVIVQVVSFKTRGKRVFRMSPLHHHFELGGWPEKKVARAFWLVSGGCSLFGLFLYMYA